MSVKDWWDAYWKEQTEKKKRQHQEDRQAGNRPRGKSKDRKTDDGLGEYIPPKGTLERKIVSPDTFPEEEPLPPEPTGDPKELASKVVGWVREDAPDFADCLLLPEMGYSPDGWAERINGAQAKGVKDLKGWLTEELCNDSAALKELLDNPLRVAAGSNEMLRREILQELLKEEHLPLKAAGEALLTA